MCHGSPFKRSIMLDDEMYCHRARLFVHRHGKRTDPGRSVAVGLLLLAVVVAFSAEQGDSTGISRARLRVPVSPPFRSLPLSLAPPHFEARESAHSPIRRRCDAA